MTKTLIALAILALILYYCYQKQTKPTKETPNEPWIWTSEELSNPGYQTSLDYKTKYQQKVQQLDQEQLAFNKLEEENESLKQELQNLKQSAKDDSLLEEIEDLTSERDQAIRNQKSLEQELLALNNRLNNKVQETTRKAAEITRLKQEANQKDKALNKQIKDKNGLITSLQREINQSKDNLSKLQAQHTEQLKAINLLFDPQAEDFAEIDFSGLYVLLEGIAKNEKS